MPKKIEQLLAEFVPTGNMGIHRELAEFLRRKIEADEIAAGSMLPSQREMAALCHTNAFSVKLASDELARLGLIAKQPGRGMFVVDRCVGIRNVAIYTSDSVEHLENHAFSSAFREILCRKLQQAGIGYELLFDCRPEAEHDSPPEQLRRALAEGRIQAVIGTSVRSFDEGWFNRLPVRHLSQMFDPRLEISGLAEYFSGCRRIAAVLPTHGNSPYSDILELLKPAGLPLRPRYMRQIREFEHLKDNYAGLGYRYVRELLETTPPPDALIVYPDTAVPGAIIAILEMRLKVPQELRVAFHRNMELPYFCPFPVHYLDTEISLMAEQTVRALAENCLPQS